MESRCGVRVKKVRSFKGEGLEMGGEGAKDNDKDKDKDKDNIEVKENGLSRIKEFKITKS